MTDQSVIIRSRQACKRRPRARPRRSSETRKSADKAAGCVARANAGNLAAFELGLHAPRAASGVSTSINAPCPVTGTSTTASRIFRDQMAGADIARQRHQFREKAPRPQHRIAALAVDHRHRNQRASFRVDRPQSAGRSARHRPAACRASSTTAPSISAGNAASPVRSEVDRPSAKSGLWANCSGRSCTEPLRRSRLDGR